MNCYNGVNIEKLEEYDKHHKVIFLNNPKTGLRGFIAIHRKNKNSPSFGATRFLRYENSLDGLRDALRLSRLMSYKAASAGLSNGGAKGVILMPERIKNRKKILLSYAHEVNNLRGDFITGTDAGLTQDDLKLMRKASQFFVGLNSDATQATAMGIYYGMETSLEFLTGNSDLTGKTFAIQGLGKVGHTLLSFLYSKAKHIYVADVDVLTVKKIKKEFPLVFAVKPSEIHKQNVDIFSPCALNHTLNTKTIKELNCKIIAGGANNQLENENIGVLLHKLGILYAPDYAINAGGLIAVYEEYKNGKKRNTKSLLIKIVKIKDRLMKIYKQSEKENRATNLIANEITEKTFSGQLFNRIIPRQFALGLLNKKESLKTAFSN